MINIIHFFDGKNYIRYANIIDNYLSKEENLENKYIFFTLINFLYLNFIRHLRHKILNFFVINQNQNQNNQIKGNYDSRGRFDHRIKNNDEKKYFKIFKKLKI